MYGAYTKSEQISAGNGGETTRERMENRSSTKSLLSEEEKDVNAMEGLEDDIFGKPGKSRKSRSQRRRRNYNGRKNKKYQ